MVKMKIEEIRSLAVEGATAPIMERLWIECKCGFSYEKPWYRFIISGEFPLAVCPQCGSTEDVELLKDNHIWESIGHPDGKGW